MDPGDELYESFVRASLYCQPRQPCKRQRSLKASAIRQLPLPTPPPTRLAPNCLFQGRPKSAGAWNRGAACLPALPAALSALEHAVDPRGGQAISYSSQPPRPSSSDGHPSISADAKAAGTSRRPGSAITRNSHTRLSEVMKASGQRRTVKTAGQRRAEEQEVSGAAAPAAKLHECPDSTAEPRTGDRREATTSLAGALEAVDSVQTKAVEEVVEEASVLSEVLTSPREERRRKRIEGNLNRLLARTASTEDATNDANGGITDTAADGTANREATKKASILTSWWKATHMGSISRALRNNLQQGHTESSNFSTGKSTVEEPEEELQQASSVRSKTDGVRSSTSQTRRSLDLQRASVNSSSLPNVSESIPLPQLKEECLAHSLPFPEDSPSGPQPSPKKSPELSRVNERASMEFPKPESVKARAKALRRSVTMHDEHTMQLLAEQQAESGKVPLCLAKVGESTADTPQEVNNQQPAYASTWPAAKAKPNLKPSSAEAAARKSSPLHKEHLQHKGRLANNYKWGRRVKRFDSRIRKLAREQGVKEEQTLYAEYEEVEPAVESAQLAKEEVELGFSVAAWSSQKAPHFANTLMQAHGKWETANRGVHNEYVVFELLGNPSTVTGIELTVAGNSANPRRCRMQYSESLADGLWNDAWSFSVAAKNIASSWRSRHQYGRAAKQFKESLIEHCGDVEVAWQLLDGNGDGSLSFSDLQQAVIRFERLDSNWAKGASFTEADLQKVFRELDLTGTGVIYLDDLLGEGDPRNPVALWWRLLIVENWGSPASVMLNAPVRLFSTEKSGAGTVMKKSSRDDQARFLEELVTAFHPDKLQLSPEVRMLRRVAQEYDVQLTEVEDIHKEFSRHDSDNNGFMERAEFEDLLLVLHGVKDKADVPRSRMDFFWRQADVDRDNKLDFEEFLLWYTRHLVGSCWLPSAKNSKREKYASGTMMD